MTNPIKETSLEDLMAEVDVATAIEPLDPNATGGEVTAWIQRRIASVLGLSPEEIDPDKRLTRMAINSLDALRIVGELSEALDRELPDTLFWDHPTIASIAAALGSDAVPEPDTVDPGHSRRAMRIGLRDEYYGRLHARSGSWAAPRAHPGFITKTVQEFPGSVPLIWIGDYKGVHPLATHLRQTVHFMPSGFGLLRHTRKTVLALARLYAWEMQRILAPGAPCVVAGYCFGGKVALEVARILNRGQHPVARVVLIECPGPSRTYWRTYDTLNRLLGLQRRERLLKHWYRSPADRRRGSSGNTNGTAITMPTVYEETTRHWEYQPRRTALPVALVFARESGYRLLPFTSHGWKTTLQCRPEIILLPGDHESILLPDDVSPLATLISRLCVRAELPRGGASACARLTSGCEM